VRKPSDDLITWAVIEVLRSHGVVHSQRELHELVSSRLAELDGAYAVGEGRLRRVAIRVPQVRLQVETRRGGAGDRTSCPSCGARLRPRWGRDLFGKRVLEGRVCASCRVRTGPEGGEPGRYVFVWRGGSGRRRARRSARPASPAPEPPPL
jgi:hypothetical protein